MQIGVLAVQGAFIEHEHIFQALNIPCIEIRQKKNLENIDGLILPGGESTVQGQLLHKLDLFEPIKERIANGLPVLATCAGLILLASKIEGEENSHLGTLPITVKRNAYGRQLGSFMTTASVGTISDYPQVFIRAPYITKVAHDVKILSTVNEKIVAVEYKNQIGLAFHPEMTKDPRIHIKFIEKIKKYSML